MFLKTLATFLHVTIKRTEVWKCCKLETQSALESPARRTDPLIDS